jgi:nicotinate-nucleotide pyrophosphorylase (carboxylating)
LRRKRCFLRNLRFGFLPYHGGMNSWTEAEATAARRLIELALAEDLGSAGDVTSLITIPGSTAGQAVFVARQSGVIAGLPVVSLVCAAVDSRLALDFKVSDGSAAGVGTPLAIVSGPMRSILASERTALNFLQRLSGIATLTRRCVEIVAGRAQVLDTRKTTPGWRLLEKYAVRMGGGRNHRIGLYDAILIKDNHLAALGGGASAVRAAVATARTRVPPIPIEVEVDSEELFAAALDSRPDMILLDNMPPERMRRCVERRCASAPGILLEASGGVNLETIGAIAATGVDRISVGAITHSAPALDIALDYQSVKT